MRKVLFVVTMLAVFVSGSSIAGDAAAGKAKAMICAACHGMSGISAVGIYPNLAGQKEQYLIKQIKAFRSGEREDPSMKPMTAALTDDDIANLAAHFSGLK